MTRLRKMMLEELERRNYSEATTRCYIRTVEDFSKRFKRSPDCLGPEHIREYQAELFKKRKLSPGTVTQRLAALRFFYIKTLKKTWSIAETPYPKKAFHLPSILSREEVRITLLAYSFYGCDSKNWPVIIDNPGVAHQLTTSAFTRTYGTD